MVSTEDILGSILKFNENEYFRLNDMILSERESELLDIDFMGIAINGPKQIECNRYVFLPIVMGLRYSGERDWTVDLKKNCFIIATDIDSGNVFVSRALTSLKDEYSSFEDEEGDGPLPPGLAEAATVVLKIDANEKLPLTWNTGKWAFCLLYFDWVSNTIGVDLIGPDPVDPGFAGEIDPEPNQGGITALPAYVKIKQTPELNKRGLSFFIETKKENGKPLLNLFAAYSIKIRASHIPETAIELEFENGQIEEVAAIIPLTLFLLVKNNKLPVQIDLSVPIYGNPIQEGEQVLGYCALEILSAAGIHDIFPGEYVCFLLMEGIAYGPQKIEIH